MARARPPAAISPTVGQRRTGTKHAKNDSDLTHRSRRTITLPVSASSCTMLVRNPCYPMPYRDPSVAMAVSRAATVFTLALVMTALPVS